MTSPNLTPNPRKCVICGFDRGVSKHHIIKRRDYGSDEEENLVLLCPNHHWVADFGTDEEKIEIINLLKETTGKSGKEVSCQEKESLNIKVKALIENFLCGLPFPNLNGIYNKPFSEEEWKRMQDSFNYEVTLKMLLGRGCSSTESLMLHKKAEILILIRKLKEQLDSIKF